MRDYSFTLEKFWGILFPDWVVGPGDTSMNKAHTMPGHMMSVSYVQGTDSEQ